MKEEDTERSCGRQFLLCLDVNQNKSDNQEIDRQIGDVPKSFGRQFFFVLAMATKRSQLGALKYQLCLLQIKFK